MTFTQTITNQIKYYVYRLVDPRNGETFYVGKGKGDRVFHHAKADFTFDEDKASFKIARIREILQDGHNVITIIHRHGLDEKTAYHVEGALIDAYPGLSNIQKGHHNDDLGVRSTEQILRQYTLEEADLSAHSFLLVKIATSYEGREQNDVYECARYAWSVNKERAENVDFVLAASRGEIVGVFKVEEWLPATNENFPGRNRMPPNKWGFVGKPAPAEIWNNLVHKMLPQEYRQRGPIGPQYINDER